jgi:hypothetical protein
MKNIKTQISDILNCQDNECLYRLGNDIQHCNHCKLLQIASVLNVKETLMTRNDWQQVDEANRYEIECERDS